VSSWIQRRGRGAPPQRSIVQTAWSIGQIGGPIGDIAGAATVGGRALRIIDP
jgi:hypothetical protein